jgi:hypothetical protein
MVAVSALLILSPAVTAQTHGQKERFTTVAIVNNLYQTGAGTVVLSVDRWSTDAERERLMATLREKGPRALLDALQDTRAVGRIRTPDSIGYDLHYAHQTVGEDGKRRIVLATDRPIGFREMWESPRTVDYPFTIVEMEIGPDGRGTGTLSEFTRILADGDIIHLENFANTPVMLTDVRSNLADD